MPIFPIQVPTPSAGAFGSGAAPMQIGGSAPGGSPAPAPIPVEPGGGSSPAVAAPVPITPPGAGGNGSAPPPMQINPATPIPTPDSSLTETQVSQVLQIVNQFLSSGDVVELVLTAPNGNKRRLSLSEKEIPKWTRVEENEDQEPTRAE